MSARVPEGLDSHIQGLSGIPRRNFQACPSILLPLGATPAPVSVEPPPSPPSLDADAVLGADPASEAAAVCALEAQAGH